MSAPPTASTSIDEALLLRFSAFLAQSIGLHFPRPRWPDLLRGLKLAAREFAQPDIETCIRWLLTTPLKQRQIEVLASHLTVGETYFYREPAVFTALEQHILPALIAERRVSNRTLRLWSAGCCTGEEAYTLAILLYRLIPDIAQWNITLLATDINPHFLARARSGTYRDWSFRGAPARFKESYFTPGDDGCHQLLPAIRRLVRFAHLNLVDDSYPALDNGTNGMDLILCRNVLMYFEEQGVRAVLDKLHRTLTEDGWLVLSATESSNSALAGFCAVPFPEATLYCKRAVQRAVPPLAPAPTPSPDRALPTWSEPPPRIAAPPPPPLAASSTPPLPAADTGYRQALAHYARGDYAQAATVLAGAAADDPAGLALAARTWANLGQLGEARRCGEAAVAADKCDPALRYLLASLLAEQGCDAAAAAALKQALYLDQDFVLAHFALANIYRRLGQPAQTTRHLATARRLLGAYPPDTPLPAAEGLTAGRLLDIIDSEGARR